MVSLQRELDILETVDRMPGPVRQRDIARIVGVSLGMTNAILKRLASKGWLTVRRVSGRNLKYVVTPKGLKEVARRSYRYLRRTIGSILRYRDSIDRLISAAAHEGCTRVVLVGPSDLGFIVEHSCAKQGLKLLLDTDGGNAAGARGGSATGVLVLYAESLSPSGRLSGNASAPALRRRREGGASILVAYLREYLTAGTAVRRGEESAG